MQSKLKYAVVLALGTAVISGTNNFLTKIAVMAVNDPTVFTFLKNTAVAVLLIGLLILLGAWREIANVTRRDAIMLTAVGVIGGSIPFILFFTGLSMIPAINAAFIHKTLFLWVAVMAVPLLKERIGALQLAALALLVGGNVALFGLPNFTLNAGELMVLTATLLWAVENIIAKIALRRVSSMLLASARMTIGSLIILIIIAFQGKTELIIGLSPIQWGWTLLTSVLLMGYVLTWYTALKYAPVTLVASLLVPATLITNMLTALFITHTIPQKHIISGLLLIVGTILLLIKARRIVPKQQQGTLPITT